MKRGWTNKNHPSGVVLVCLLAGPTGFEPAISSVTGRHVRPLHHEPASLCDGKIITLSAKQVCPTPLIILPSQLLSVAQTAAKAAWFNQLEKLQRPGNNSKLSLFMQCSLSVKIAGLNQNREGIRGFERRGFGYVANFAREFILPAKW